MAAYITRINFLPLPNRLRGWQRGEANMKETLGVISFWMRLGVLSCILFGTLMGIIVKQAVLKNVAG